MTRRDKRVVLLAAAVVVVVLAGIASWAALRPGRYDASRAGCVTVNLPSSMGGSLVHECGGQARRFCHSAFTSRGAAAALIRPQCRLAGIEPG